MGYLDFIQPINLIVAPALAYFVCVMMFDEQYHKGPFWFKRHRLMDGTLDLGPVNLFDWVRRAFGAYRVEVSDTGYSYWRVFEPRMAVWRCQFCLSFWVSSLLALPVNAGLVILETGSLRTFWIAPFYVLALAYVLAFLVTAINTLASLERP